MAKSKKKPAEPDDFSIPAFLRAENRKGGGKTKEVRETKKEDFSNLPGMDALAEGSRAFVTRQLESIPPDSAAVLRGLEPVVCAYIVREVSKCRFNMKWLNETAGLAIFAKKAQEAEERKLANVERLKNMTREKRVNAFEGLVPLRDILEKMGDKAPTRKNAMRAVDAANLEHRKYHFEPGVVTLARVENILQSYVPPVKARAAGGGGPKPEFDGHAVIQFPGDNPKKEGTGPHGRWKFLKDHHGKTVEVFLKGGGNPVTLANALKSKHATLKGGGMHSGVKGERPTQVIKDDPHVAREKDRIAGKVKMQKAKKVKTRKKRM